MLILLVCEHGHVIILMKCCQGKRPIWYENYYILQMCQFKLVRGKVYASLGEVHHA